MVGYWYDFNHGHRGYPGPPAAFPWRATRWRCLYKFFSAPLKQLNTHALYSKPKTMWPISWTNTSDKQWEELLKVLKLLQQPALLWNPALQACSTASVAYRHPQAQLVKNGVHHHISFNFWLYYASTDLGFYYSLKICILRIESCSIFSSCFMKLYFQIA